MDVYGSARFVGVYMGTGDYRPVTGWRHFRDGRWGSFARRAVAFLPAVHGID